MDFRELEAVHDLVCERDAEKVESPLAGAVGAFSDYLPAMWSIWRQRNWRGSEEWSGIDVLKLITWHLPFFSWHLRVVRREMHDGLEDFEWLRRKLVQLFRVMLQPLRARL